MNSFARRHHDIRKATVISLVLIFHLTGWRLVERSWLNQHSVRSEAPAIQIRLVPQIGMTPRAVENQDHVAPDMSVKRTVERTNADPRNSAERPASSSAGASDAPARIDVPTPNEREHAGSTQATILIDNALRSAGRVDKEVRQESPRRFGNEAAQRPAMERAIGSAGKSRTTTMENLTAPDGTRMTKVTGPFGTYCVLQSSTATAAGFDLIERGMAQRTVNCP